MRSSRLPMGSGIVMLPLALLLPIALWAQGSRGTIAGVIRDPSGAVMPNVTVTAVNEQTGSGIVVESLADGVYQARQLLPGNYTISAQHPGFKRVDISGLKVDVGSTLTQDLTLEVGAVTETMKVTGQSSLVETTSGEVAATVSIDLVLEMPLVDRNVYNLINLTPGGYFVGGNQPRAYINGSRGWETSGFLDGVTNNRGPLGTQNIEMLPPVDSMQEFKVEASNYSAETGRSQGASVTAATKSGTNAFHGTFYEFLRNDKLDAKGWGADKKPPLRRNNFGGTIGGPIRKNKTFFFVNYEGLRQGQGSTVTRNVGLPEWRTGNFSTAARQSGTTGIVVPIYDPETGGGTVFAPLGNSPFPGNTIPASRLDPVAVKALSYLPSPNRTPDNPFTQAGNWQLNSVGVTTQDYYVARVDHDWSDKTKMFVRSLFTKPQVTTTPYLQGWGVADPNATENRWSRHNHALNLTHLFSPVFFLSFSMGYSRFGQITTSGGCCETDFAALLGIPNTRAASFPYMYYTGGLVPVTSVGNAASRRRVFDNNVEWNGNFTRILGDHTLKFGATHSRHQGNLARSEEPSMNYSPGAKAPGPGFDGRFTRGITATGAAVANTGLNLADFLLGRMIGVTATLTPMYGKRIQYYGGYFQDDWRATPSLTLNVGLRYDTETPMYELANRYATFLPYAPNPLAGTGDIPAGATGITLFQNRNGNGKYITNWDRNNFAPRFGFAYRLLGSSNTTLRGGYGLYFGASGPDAAEDCGFNPFSITYSAAFPLPFRLRDGLPSGALALPGESELTPTFGNRGTRFEAANAVLSVDPAGVTPYSQNFNFTVQHQWKGILFETGYRGNLSRQVPLSSFTLNRIPYTLLSHTEIPARLRRPWTVFASDEAEVRYKNLNWGVANYHAFVFRSEYRFRNGIGWTVSFTHSKQLDNTPYVSGTGLGDNDQPQALENRKLEKSRSTGDVGNRFVFAPMVDLPFGQGRKWMNRGGVLNALLGGWQVSTIGTLQGGAPFGVSVLNGGINVLGDSLASLRPNLVGDPNSSSQGRPAASVRGLQWLDPAAFATPARFTYGTAARTLPGVTGPGIVSFDAMLAKNFSLAERYRFQFRWETFNSFNTPTFALPGQDFGSSSFGVVTSAGGRRIMQFGLKLYW